MPTVKRITKMTPGMIPAVLDVFLILVPRCLTKSSLWEGGRVCIGLEFRKRQPIVPRMLPQGVDVSAVAQILSSFPLSICLGLQPPLPPHRVTHIQGRSSLLSYMPLATASQVHSEVRLLGDSKLSRAGNEN